MFNIVLKKHTQRGFEVTEKVITVRIKGKAVDQLERLKEDEGASSHSQIVRNALRVYNTLESYKDKDGSIIIEGPDGKRMKLIMPP